MCDKCIFQKACEYNNTKFLEKNKCKPIWINDLDNGGQYE